jgi:lambda family phage portal protein
MAKPRVRLKTDAGGVMPRANAGAYAGASTVNRDVLAWNPSRGSAMADLSPDLPNLIYRNRDIYRNNGVAHAGVQTIIDNVVGTGLRLSARPNYLALGKTKEWAVEWAAQAQSFYHAWWHSTACDAADTLTGDQLTAQVMFSKLNNGASFTLPLWIPDRGDGYATKLQTVEIDRLSNPYNASDTRTFHGGIEFGQYGEPLAAHIRRGHPGDTFNESDPKAYTWERIPRRTSFGRLRWIHDFDADRPGMTRGAPLMASILPQFKNLDRYTQAELQAAVGNAMIFATLETTMTGDEILEVFTKDPAAWYKARQEQAVRMQSGSMLPIAPGDKMNPFLPTRPASGFGAFVENIHRIIGVALDMPYELLMKDFSKTTYSSARAAMLEAWRSFNRRRDWLGTMWLDPIYGLFLEELVNDGRIDAPGFYENRAAYLRCRWIGPGKGWVDPVKEAQAARERISARVSTIEDECAEQGKDWEEVFEQLAREEEKRKELKLPENTKAAAPVAPYKDSTRGPEGENEDEPTNQPNPDAPEGDRPSGRGSGDVDATAPPIEGMATLVEMVGELTETVRLQAISARPQNLHFAPPPQSTDASVLAEAVAANGAMLAQAMDANTAAVMRLHEQMARPRTSKMEILERDENGFTRKAVKTEAPQ